MSYYDTFALKSAEMCTRYDEFVVSCALKTHNLRQNILIPLLPVEPEYVDISE
jgi:hypothetical protein